MISYKEAFFEEKDSSLCLIMEFADRGDLYQKIIQNKKKAIFLEEMEIWRIFIQLVKGLKSLHELKILHRDLKSANVFLFSNGLVKLGDLNVSKVVKKGLSYTQTGTPYYASPEVWKDQPYNNKSDIWSLGCVLYEMITLYPPFRAENMEGLFNKVIKGVYGKIPQRFSRDLNFILNSLLQVNPSNRPSCEDILKLQVIQNKIQFFNHFGLQDDFEEKILLQTIKIPKNLIFLGDKLPPKNYNESYEKKYRSYSNKNVFNECYHEKLENEKKKEIDDKDKDILIVNNNNNNNDNNNDNNNKINENINGRNKEKENNENNNNKNRIVEMEVNFDNNIAIKDNSNNSKNKINKINMYDINNNNIGNKVKIIRNNRLLIKSPNRNFINNSNLNNISSIINNNKIVLNNNKLYSERLISIESKLNAMNKINEKKIIYQKERRRNNSDLNNNIFSSIENLNSLKNIIPEKKVLNKNIKLSPIIHINNHHNNNLKYYKIYSPYIINNNYQQRLRQHYSSNRKIVRNGSMNNIGDINHLGKYYEQFNMHRKNIINLYLKNNSMIEKEHNFLNINKRKLSPIKKKVINIC